MSVVTPAILDFGRIVLNLINLTNNDSYHIVLL